MVADEGTSPIRYQIPPYLMDLSAHSREQIMDEHPIAYRVMAQELKRENKLRPFGAVDGEKASDPRNYLYIEAKVANRDSAVAALVRLRGEERWLQLASGPQRLRHFARRLGADHGRTAAGHESRRRSRRSASNVW